MGKVTTKQANARPDWSASDPFEGLPRFMMRIEEMETAPICDSCGNEDATGVYWVKVEKRIFQACHKCLVQQTRASATRDTLVRIVGVIYQEEGKKKV